MSSDAPRPIAAPGELRALVERLVVAWRDQLTEPARPGHEHLATAVTEGRLRVAYQPIVDLVDGRIVAIEALVRLPDPPVPDLDGAPNLIAVAESSGLIGAVGTSVLTSAATQLAAWRSQTDVELQVHVNVSPLELRDPRYVDRLQRILAVTGLPAEALVLEITETAALQREGAAQRTLVSLTALGIDIALDDFGTGFASLDLLAATPATSLKLDRSFIDSVGDETDAVRGRAVIVQAAIGLGRSLGLEIVAEGIETPTQARTLLAWGCQFGQGYLYSRPRFAEELDLQGANRKRATSLTQPVPTGQLLSAESIDLALALATTCRATDGDGGRLRSDAAAVAGLIEHTLSSDRDHADTAVLLATIGDAPDRLRTLGSQAETTNLAAHDLVAALSVPPIISRHTPPGAVARTAWALANVRMAGAEHYDPALLAAHPDPAVDATLRTAVDTWWDDPCNLARQQGDLQALEKRLRGRDDADQRLRALLGLARAIGSTGSLEDVLELTAEEALRALGAASVSVSRWEPEEGCIRTLINVGDLADWEQTRPTDETYDTAHYPRLAERMFERTVSVESLGVMEGNDPERHLLQRVGKGSSAAVPIVLDDVVWGELYATTAVGQPSFTLADAPYLSAVASFVGIAISRVEDVGRLARLVHEDPLTRLANRRRLDDHVAALLERPERDTPVSIVMIDVNGLKQINDEYGHRAGDQLLVAVADTLQRMVISEPDGLAARLGGDEFCIAVSGDEERALGLVERIDARLQGGPPPQVRLSIGIASNHGAPEAFGDLLARADAAQYTAKRQGDPVVVDGDTIAHGSSRNGGPAGDRRRRRIHDDATRHQVVNATARWAQPLCDVDRPLPNRLVAVGELALALLDLNRWTLSLTDPGSDLLRIDAMQLRRARPRGASAPIGEEVYDLHDYPATLAAFETGTLHIDIEDPDADPAERELLEEHGLRYMLALAETDGDGSRWLLELFGDDQSLTFPAAAALVAALRAPSLQGVAVTPLPAVRG